MPKRITICSAVAVTFSRSFDVPVVISPKTISSVARRPSVIAHRVQELRRVSLRNLSSLREA